MSSRPPEFIEPWRLAERGAALEGELELSGMTRLRPSLASTEGSASFSMAFSIDERGCRRISGRVSARLAVVCQRCLEPMTVDIDSSISLGLAPDAAAAAKLPEDVEPLVLDQEPVPLARLIEDELILALPLAPMHERRACTAAPADEPRAETGGKRQRDNPFAVLAGLKRSGQGGED